MANLDDLDSDVVLRLKTSCTTAFSHYDQVVAISQEIINKGFEGLYAENQDLAQVHYSSKRYGSINGNLYSPRVLLGGREGTNLNLAAALYVMRFKDGTLVIPSDDDDEDDREEDLTDWNLAVKINLEKQFVTVDPNADPDERERQQKIWDFIHNKFDIPGDYSIYRLYVKLSDAVWDDYDYEASQFGHNDDGTPRSWGQLIKKYPDLQYTLPIFLKKWARKQEDESMTMTGVKLEVDPTKGSETKDPTFQPTAMIHQIFPYTNPAKGVDEPVVSYELPGNLNSLLYCEMVEDHPLPKDKQLASRGNFTTQSSTQDPRIDGTFVLSHQLFLEEFLLPMLSAFNMASIICPTEVIFDTGDHGDSYISWDYSVGYDQDHPDPNDEIYLFKPVYPPGTPEDVSAYKFSWEHPLILSPNGYNAEGDYWGSYSAKGTSEVNFEWVPGDNGFNITGESEYKYDVEWSSRSDMQYPFGWLRDGYKFTWSMKIYISSVDGGVLEMGIDAGPQNDCYANFAMTQHEQQQGETPEGQTERIRDTIFGQISGQVQWLQANLLNKFQTTAQLTYPGYGTFDFSDPTVGNTGEILTTIAFKDIGSTKVQVPAPQVPILSPKKVIPSLPVTARIPCVVPFVKLVWSFSKPVKGTSKDFEILINGKNNSDKAISLVSVSIILGSEPNGQALITGKDFKADKWTIGKPSETKRNVFQIVVDTDGTPAFSSVTAEAGEETYPELTPITFSGTGKVIIPPGSSLTLALLTGTGVPNTYPVSITEGWPEEKEKASQSLVKKINVISSP
ncbi:hypothetical protein V8C35DRAFT_318600 [Trichoderma chlorosporum]